MAQTQWNKDLPAEAVLKQVLVEKGKLESEVQYLANELAMKNKAIKEFKKWQAQVAERSIYYWLTEGWTFKNALQRTKEDKNVQFLFERILSEESEKEVG